MTPELFLKYTLGIPSVDHHHWVLFSEMDQITDKLIQGEYDEAGRMASVLTARYREHCDEENKLMIRSNYPYIVEHLDSHRTMIMLLESVTHTPLSPADGVVLRDALYIVLPKHILEFDLPMAYYIHNKEAYDFSNYTGRLSVGKGRQGLSH